VQGFRTNRFRVKIGMVSMFVLFWRSIPLVPKTLKSKYDTSVKFMFSSETCFSISGRSALEFFSCFARKDQRKAGAGKCPKLIPGVYITRWLNQP